MTTGGPALSYLVQELEVFAETRRVVIPDRLGVSEALEHGGRLEDLLGDQVGRGLVHVRQEVEEQLAGLRLAGAALAGYDDHLVKECTFWKVRILCSG